VNAMKSNHLFNLLLVITICAVVLIGGCATQSVPKERLNKVAVITSGSTNVWTFLSTAPSISVVEVDGVRTENSYGPIELEPGPHKIKMKCGIHANELEITVAAGDVYEFAIAMGGRIAGCEGSLVKVKSAKK
jgi:hypothetical protein